MQELSKIFTSVGHARASYIQLWRAAKCVFMCSSLWLYFTSTCTGSKPAKNEVHDRGQTSRRHSQLHVRLFFPWRVLFFDSPNVNSGTFFLSINRFERKKNLELALKAFAHFRLSPRKCAADRVILVLAGGFDKRLKENVEYFKQLKR